MNIKIPSTSGSKLCATVHLLSKFPITGCNIQEFLRKGWYVLFVIPFNHCCQIYIKFRHRLSFTHKLSRVSKSLTTLFGMQHLTYGTNFLHLFAFLVSRPPQSSPPSPGSDSAPKSVVGVSHRVFHSRLKTHLSPDPFPRNLPLSLSNGLISWFHGSLALKTLASAAD